MLSPGALAMVVLVVLLSGASLALPDTGTWPAAAVSEAFSTPPTRFRPKFRYWLPDASVAAEAVRHDIQTVAEAGGGGVEFLPFYLYGMPLGGTPPTDWNQFSFGSPAFKKLLKAALEETASRGLAMDIVQGASQGQGVPSIPRTPGLAVELVYGTADVAPGSSFSGPVPHPVAANFIPGFMHAPERFGEPSLKAVLVGSVAEVSLVDFPTGPGNRYTLDGASVTDITAQVVNNRLNWTPPAGNSTWKIIAMYEDYTNERSCTGAPGAADIIANGSWIVDHFSAAGAKRITDFWDTNLLDTQEMRSLVSSVGRYFWEDSMEMQSALFWSSGMIERFERNRGYSVTKFLPLIFDASNQWGGYLQAYNESWVYSPGGPKTKAAVLADYRTTLTEGYQEYLGHFVNWTRTLGVKYSAQPAYNLPLDMHAAIPVLDAPETESLGFPTVDAMRQFSGAALLAGKSVISTEVGAVRTAAYTQTIPELVDLFKQSFSAGVSEMMIHGLAYSGEYILTNWPGYNSFLFAFTEMWSDKLPSWKQIKDALDFTARTSLILQTGQPQTDVVFYNYASPWRPTTKFQSTVLSDSGYSYDYLGPENLSPSLQVKDKLLAPQGPSYQALVLSNETAITGSAVDAVEAYAAAGLPVFLLGQVPKNCLGINACPKGDPEGLLLALVSRFQNVKAVSTANDLPAALRAAGVFPRAEFKTSVSEWYTTWRKSGDGLEDYVYIYNAGPAATVPVHFRVNPSSAPSILDGWTGQRLPLAQYELSNAGIVVPVTLQAKQSRIYAFARGNVAGTAAAHVTSSSGQIDGIYVNGNGTLEARVFGPASFTLSSGKTVTSNATVPCARRIKAWDLTLQSYVPASATSTANAIEVIRRAGQAPGSWSQIDGLQTISGVGEYNSTFAFSYDPAKTGASISFGPIKDTLRAWINGQQLPPIDPTHSHADITKFLQRGTNSIRIVVTSTLFNAVQSRANTTMMLGRSAAESQPLYGTLPKADFGLIGPVILRPLQRIALG